MNIGDIYWEMIIYMEDYTIFLDYVGKNYKQIKDKLKLLSNKNHQAYDDDAFHEVIIRCHNAIQKKGYLKDKSDYGIQSYIIISYFNYLREVQRAAVNKKRDKNYDSSNIDEAYEQYYNKTQSASTEKIKDDLFKDYSILYIMQAVEQNFTKEDFYLFRLKNLCGFTYKQVAEKTQLKGVRTRILQVKKFLQDNVTKEVVKDSFNELFGDLVSE